MTRSSQVTDSTYDLKTVKLPRLSGLSLRLLVKILEGPFRAALTKKLFRDAGIEKLRNLKISEPPTYYPLHRKPENVLSAAEIKASDWLKIASQAPGQMPWPSVADYVTAYRQEKTTPLEVAQKALRAIDASNAVQPPLRAITSCDREDVLKQAEASTKRIQQGGGRGILEGVPVAVKDELDLKGYSTKGGTQFLGSKSAAEDATVVARLRAAGALLIGKTNMHEIGIGVTGLNPHYGTARNPYNLGHYTGGSSSGSAAAVAAGLCPLAVGADGGGSIRIPASFCGLVGLKSTFSRVSESGALTLVWSVAHNGVLANNAADAALAYGLIAGPDERDALTLGQPPVTLEDWDRADLTGVKLGVYSSWFNHASQEAVSACEKLVQQFEEMGAEIVAVEIPELDAGRIAHLVSIAGEMTQALERYYSAHHKEYGLDVRLNLALARQFTARDFLQAQRMRSRLMMHFEKAFKQVDAILSPATGLPAPEIPKSALLSGESDLTTATEIMRFVTPANLAGLPAISFPAGYSKTGLPIGLQVMGRAWQEHFLLRLAFAAEKVVTKQKPALCYQLL